MPWPSFFSEPSSSPRDKLAPLHKEVHEVRRTKADLVNLDHKIQLLALAGITCYLLKPLPILPFKALSKVSLYAAAFNLGARPFLFQAHEQADSMLRQEYRKLMQSRPTQKLTHTIVVEATRLLAEKHGLKNIRTWEPDSLEPTFSSWLFGTTLSTETRDLLTKLEKEAPKSPSFHFLDSDEQTALLAKLQAQAALIQAFAESQGLKVDEWLPTSTRPPSDEQPPEPANMRV